MIKINMPDGAKMIIEKLNNAGFEAYIVGGCVRDSIMDRDPHDWDITTSALPEEVKSIFTKTIDTGIQHGTVTVMYKGEGFEITTYRVDGEYRDHRRPDSVTFTRSLREDLRRRDFTINAMAYNDTEGLVDLFGGEKDIEDKIIRCVGNPDDRFDEDALRIMRAVRFSAQLGFDIEKETEEAIKRHTEFLRDISAERIQMELTKLLLSKYPGKLEDAYRLGITAVILPEFDLMRKTPQNSIHHAYDVGGHTIKVIENVPAEITVRYAALLHDSGKPACHTVTEDGRDHFHGHNEEGEKVAMTVLRRLKLSNEVIRDVSKLVLWHDYGMAGGVSEKNFRHRLSELGLEYFDRLMQIRYADIMGQSEYNRDVKLKTMNRLKEMEAEIVEKGYCLSAKDLKITGKDLIDLGVKPGPLLGKILDRLLYLTISSPSLNDHELLVDKALELIKEYSEN